MVAKSWRFAHGRVLRLKNVKHGVACLGAQVSGEQDTTARPVGEIPAGRADASGEQAGVEGAKGLFIRLWPRGTPVTKTCFGFEIIEEGVVVTETPKVHAALNLETNFLASLDTMSHLEDHGDKHQGFLGVPLAEPDTQKFVTESTEKRLANLSLQDQVAVG